MARRPSWSAQRHPRAAFYHAGTVALYLQYRPYTEIGTGNYNDKGDAMPQRCTLPIRSPFLYLRLTSSCRNCRPTEDRPYDCPIRFPFNISLAPFNSSVNSGAGHDRGNDSRSLPEHAAGIVGYDTSGSDKRDCPREDLCSSAAFITISGHPPLARMSSHVPLPVHGASQYACGSFRVRLRNRRCEISPCPDPHPYHFVFRSPYPAL